MSRANLHPFTIYTSLDQAVDQQVDEDGPLHDDNGVRGSYLDVHGEMEWLDRDLPECVGSEATGPGPESR